MKEIAENDYNVTISGYIRTAEAEINLAATHDKLVMIEVEILKAVTTHDAFLKELGVTPLPMVDSDSTKSR